MSKKQNNLRVNLDAKEREMRNSLEKGEWQTISNVNVERESAKLAAMNYRKTKEKRISIRVFSQDLAKLKALAEEEGLPYQTLVTSILHKYTTGRLKDTKALRGK
jgi:predicted DNA binding CopG/RHH family protein